MDRRSWPWKKKSSDKVTGSAEHASSFSPAGNHGEEGNTKKIKYVQITEEIYAHLTELEDEVKASNEKLSTANEKLSSVLAENSNKDNLVKQHAKVAEEAVSGWEKAEAEAIALKSQLESVTLLKLTAENHASHLDGALKECMRQIRSVKEESEQKLHDVVFVKTKQWERVKGEFEGKIIDLEQELLRASAENNALLQSLQERSNLLIKTSEEKSQADAQMGVLKSNIQSLEREISSLKYELHIASKELEIRNEEKNMSMRSAEVANKQHLEGVKKIAKLEAECQRLRGLVRKKLPGPAALAQMKLEVESLGRDNVEPRIRRSPVKNSSPHMTASTEFSLESVQNHKENEFLTARLLTMEEETKMLKEALSKRNSELLASRNMCAKTTSRLRALEAQILVLNQRKNHSKLNFEIPLESAFSQSASNPPSLTSMSEDGLDEEASCADSWATALISEVSQIKNKKNVGRINKTESSNHLDLMDDFLEMERLACLSTKSNEAVSSSGREINKGNEKENAQATEVVNDDDIGPNESFPCNSDRNDVSLESIQARIDLIFESQDKDLNICEILDDIKKVVLDMQSKLTYHPQVSTPESGISSTYANKPSSENGQISDHEFEKAISEIHSFAVSLGKEVKKIQDDGRDDQGLSGMIEEFLLSVRKVLLGEMNLSNFIHDLSSILAKATELNFNIIGVKVTEGESSSSDCVDKVTLLENKIQSDRFEGRFSSECNLVCHSISDPELSHDGYLEPGFELNARLCKCAQVEIEQLKLERNNLTLDLARCSESLEEKRVHLERREQLLEELKCQLASSQKSNSLAETQLKCMAESYKSLETRMQDLQAQTNFLRVKAEGLVIELQEEKQNHDDALARCRELEVKCHDLEEQIQRTEKCSRPSSCSADDSERIKQEREIAAAAEKLAECQETILLLGKQLNALRSPADPTDSPRDRHKPSEFFEDSEAIPTRTDFHGRGSHDFDETDMGNLSSPMNFDSPMSPSLSDADPSPITRSPISSKRPKHKAPKSSSLVMSSEKNGRGFSRFFSKGKTAH